MKRKLLVMLLMVAGVAALPGLARVSATETVTIRMATLAPAGSSWDKVFKAWSNTLKEKTAGGVQFQFFNGGVAGDERDVIRKMKVGQMDAGGLTSIGLGQIDPSVGILQMAGIFENYKELNYVRNALAGEFEDKFQKKGYKLLGWGDAGFGRVFSKKPILLPSDYKAVRPWVPREDPSLPELMKIIGANGVALGIPEVFPALQTGMVDTIISSAIAAVALQWFRHVTHVSKDAPVAIVGATLVREELFNKLPPDHKAALLETGKKAHDHLIELVQKEDAKAYKTLLDMGKVEFDAMGTPAQKDAWDKVNTELHHRLTGRLWSQELFDRVKATAKEARGK